MRELCAKLGFAELTPEELERVVARVERGGEIKAETMEAALNIAADPVIPFPLDSRGYSVEGTVAPGYESVRSAFENNFRRGLERNSQLCVYKDGQLVVDLHGSSAAHSTREDYCPNTLQIVFSSTKAITSAVFALAADRGVLDYEDKVAKHWPEFAQNGKADMTIADVLRHDAGMASFSESIPKEAVLDQVRSAKAPPAAAARSCAAPRPRARVLDQANPDGEMGRIIAAQRPWSFSSGPAKGQTPRMYHGISRGYIRKTARILRSCLAQGRWPPPLT